MDIFNILAQNIHCGYTLEPPLRGGSNEYPQCMFWIKNKKIVYTPANPSFFYIKVGFKGVLHRRVFLMVAACVRPGRVYISRMLKWLKQLYKENTKSHTISLYVKKDIIFTIIQWCINDVV